MSLTTTLPAPITELSPIVTPGTTGLPADPDIVANSNRVGIPVGISSGCVQRWPEVETGRADEDIVTKVNFQHPERSVRVKKLSPTLIFQPQSHQKLGRCDSFPRFGPGFPLKVPSFRPAGNCRGGMALQQSVLSPVLRLGQIIDLASQHFSFQSAFLSPSPAKSF